MIGNELFRLLTNLGEKLTKEEAKALMRNCVNLRTRRDSWSSNLSWRGCALLRSKCLLVLSDLYCTILYCTLHYSTVQYNTVQCSNGSLHSCPDQSLGSLCRLNCNCPSIFVAVKLCLTFVLVSVFIVYSV